MIDPSPLTRRWRAATTARQPGATVSRPGATLQTRPRSSSSTCSRASSASPASILARSSARPRLAGAFASTAFRSSSSRRQQPQPPGVDDASAQPVELRHRYSSRAAGASRPQRAAQVGCRPSRPTSPPPARRELPAAPFARGPDRCHLGLQPEPRLALLACAYTDKPMARITAVTDRSARATRRCPARCA